MKAFDLVVVGSGIGGYIAAIRAAQLGMKVGLVEEAPVLGGVCLNWGCIPTKAILASAELFAAVKHGVPGLVVESLSANYGAVIEASRKVAERLNRGVRSLMKKNQIEVIAGRGRLAPGKQVIVKGEAGEEACDAAHVILATGSTEFVFPGMKVDGKRLLTSREALEAKELPRSLIVIGGGAVGLEFAYVYNAYGVDVTLVEMKDQLLPGTDRETTDALQASLTRAKIKIKTNTAYKNLEQSGPGAVVTVETEKGQEELHAEQVLLAVGRRAQIANLGLEATGVALEGGFIKVRDDFRTSVEGVYAVGDCSGPPLLAHKASHEGVAAVEFIAGQRKHRPDPRRIPACVYCQPQVATVGLSEAEAKALGHDVKVGKVPFVASGKAVGTGHTEGFVKMVTDAKYGEILGCQIIGHGATELIAEVALAMTLEATVREIGETCHAHPTLSEMVAEAALASAGRSLNF